MKEHTVWDTAGLFNVTRGFVQSLLMSASSFASCMVHFTRVSLSAIVRVRGRLLDVANSVAFLLRKSETHEKVMSYFSAGY